MTTYGKPYSFQQQNGCQERGLVYITVPEETNDYENDTIPEKVNGSKMGVSFQAWIPRSPQEWSVPGKKEWTLELFWERSFYPDVQMVANDLYEKGLLEAGKYAIDIDW